MSVYPNILENRIRLMEEKINQLSATLIALLENKEEKAWKAETTASGLSHLPFTTAGENGAPDILGCVEAGQWGAGHRAVRLSSSGDTHLSLSAGQALYLRAKRHLSVHAPVLHVETQKMDVDGELAARPSYTEAFTWRSGQPPVRMVHNSLGLPVLSRLEKSGKNEHLGVRMYIDETDGYWYLHGQADKEANVVAEAICFGRV